MVKHFRGVVVVIADLIIRPEVMPIISGFFIPH
jgi:hypothetical protein